MSALLLPIQSNASQPVQLQMNFHNVSLDTVLDYVSNAAGLIIVKEADLRGTFDFSTTEFLSKEQAIGLINSVIQKQGCALTCDDRILTVRRIDSVKTADLEVATGNNPDRVAKSDQVMTQIIPVRYANAAQLVNNLQLLLPSNTSLSVNESANSLVLVASKTVIRRMLRIVQALDTSMAAVSSIKVFPLRYADAKQLASVIQQLFSTQTTSAPLNTSAGFGPPGFGGPPATEGNENTGRNAAGLKVVATGDQTSNCLIVSASVDSLRAINEMVQQVDRPVVAATELRMFQLQHADAIEIADQLGQLFADTSKNGSSQDQPAQMFGGPPASGGGPGGGFFGGPGGAPGLNMDTTTTSPGTHSKVSGQVLAVADPRTSSLLVSASSLLMPQIAKMIEELDASSARREVVKVFELQNADPQDVNQVLQDLFNRNTTRNNNNNQSLLGQGNPLTTRETGTSSQTSGFANGGSGASGNGGSRGF
jgi:general secretion pathway protein D